MQTLHLYSWGSPSTDLSVPASEAFSGLECKALRRICRGVRRQRLEPGQRVCRENDVAEGFFHILKGTASAWASEQFLMELAEGSAVGEDVLRGEARRG